MKTPTLHKSKPLVVADQLISSGKAVAKVVSDTKPGTLPAKTFHPVPAAKKRVYRNVKKLGDNDKNVEVEVAEEDRVCFRNLRFHYGMTEGNGKACEDCDRNERKCNQLHYEQFERKGLTKQDVLDQVDPQTNKKKRNHRIVLAEAVRNDPNLK